jgi:hypothetical protein
MLIRKEMSARSQAARIKHNTAQCAALIAPYAGWASTRSTNIARCASESRGGRPSLAMMLIPTIDSVR